MYEEMGYYDGNFASVMQTTNLALKPILIGGTPEQVQYFSKHILEGKGYAAFALTEPQSGSDASNVKTTAVKEMCIRDRGEEDIRRRQHPDLIHHRLCLYVRRKGSQGMAH